jgi:integrase
MRDLNYQFKKLCERNPMRSKTSHAARQRNLDLFANQLHDLGFCNLTIYGLKPKHVTALLNHWRAANLSVSTIKNRMANLRWWSVMVGKEGMIAGNNSAFEIPNRVYVTNQSKALELSLDNIASISDRHVRLSLLLQRAFGLRREEALKFQPAFADRGDHITLMASWCKGGQARSIPITDEFQRKLLNAVHSLAGHGSLIPPGRRYKEQRSLYEKICQRAGIVRPHGLRHAYAQSRYLQLTGWSAPAVGGPTSKELSPEQKQADHLARMTISEELGHHREQITAVYLGR